MSGSRSIGGLVASWNGVAGATPLRHRENCHDGPLRDRGRGSSIRRGAWSPADVATLLDMKKVVLTKAVARTRRIVSVRLARALLQANRHVERLVGMIGTDFCAEAGDSLLDLGDVPNGRDCFGRQRRPEQLDGFGRCSPARGVSFPGTVERVMVTGIVGSFGCAHGCARTGCACVGLAGWEEAGCRERSGSR